MQGINVNFERRLEKSDLMHHQMNTSNNLIAVEI